MAVVGKLAAGLISAANENTLALASLKFDFSLLKVDAPQEYSALGNALSTRRRREAEDGPQHRTARRLGALFEQVIPSTPHLIKAYGLRASEIINTSGINPQGSPRDGPFEMFVGADGTAFWAAATSGISTLAVYLLACLLAKAWEPKVAVAIWVEIITQRRKEVQEGHQNHQHISESSYLSTLQDISRRELAQWDASARAWLQSAERAKLVQDTQLMLIIKNVNLPFPGGPSVLSQVLTSWRQAMICLDCLLKGEPQVISNQVVLLAFSAWHLYPDLMVLEGSPKKVSFNDTLVDPSGLGTLAFQSRSSDEDYGTTWSLALSHLRYYGDPVVAESDPNFSRITMDQLHLIALGNLLDHWQVKLRDTGLTCQWLIYIWTHLKQQDFSYSKTTKLGNLSWLRIFAEAAAKCEHADVDEKAKALKLLAFGRRRAKSFLGVSSQVLIPYFGLANPCILRSLCCEEDYRRGLLFLRELAGQHGLKSGETFI